MLDLLQRQNKQKKISGVLKMSEENKQIEWYLRLTTDNGYGDPEGYCFSDPSDSKDEIRLIEYKAYEKLQQELEQLKENTLKDFKDIQELKTRIKEMSDHSKGCAHCGMDMFAHTKWRKFAEILSLK